MLSEAEEREIDEKDAKCEREYEREHPDDLNNPWTMVIVLRAEARKAEIENERLSKALAECVCRIGLGERKDCGKCPPCKQRQKRKEHDGK